MLRSWLIAVLAPLLCALLSLSGGACSTDDGGATPDAPAADVADVADAADGGEQDTPTPDPTPDATPDATPDSGWPVPFCDGATRQRYEPFAAALPHVFPDDFFTVDDDSLPTGLRVSLHAPLISHLETAEPAVHHVYHRLAGLDGFGNSAPVVMRFSAPVGAVPSGDVDSIAQDAVQLLDLSGDPPARVPFEAQLLEQDQVLLLWPMLPLAPRTRHAVVITTAQPDADGGCIAPSHSLRELLVGSATAPELARLVPRYADLLARTDLAPEEISAAVVFTTQTTTPSSEAIAADIRGRTYRWLSDATCEAPSGAVRRCERTYESWDYRDEDGVVRGTEPRAAWEVPVTIWLPTGGEAPHALLLAGHGLNASRSVGGSIASRVGDLGFAVVAADAVKHGDHPSVGDDSSLIGTVEFLGIDADNFTADGLLLRDNFRQSNFDRLQLLELIAQDPDLDSDGVADVDIERLGYVGISLGGILGSELLAVSERIRVAVLAVAGARLTSMISHAERLQVVMDVLGGLAGSDGGAWQLIAVLQAAAEAGDPINFAPHVLRDRLVGGDAPHVLVTMALDDVTVPNPTTRALTRALDAPVMAPLVQEVGIVPLVTGPLVGNLNDGATTAALFQYDRVSKGGGVEAASHDNTPFCEEATLQLRTFLQSWLDNGVPEIIDPYAALGTPPIEATP